MRIFGIILAGGSGRRLGGVDKANLRLGGETLLNLALARLAPQVEQVAISANGDLGRFGMTLPVLGDAVALGPLAGVLAALQWAAAEGADYVASCPVDCPHFPCDLVAQLRLALEMKEGGVIALAQDGQDQGARVHATFGLWPVALRHDLAAFLASGANPKMQDFAAAYPVAFARFRDDGAFDNINTPDDLARLTALVQQGAA